MSDFIDDRSPVERLIGTALAAPPTALLAPTIATEDQRVLTLVAERLAHTPERRAPGRRRFALAGGAIGILAAVVVAVAVVPGLLRPTLTVRHFAVSWAYRYGSISAIGDASPLVVLGTVERIARSGPDPQSPGIPETTFAVAVERTLKGTAPAGPLFVVQSGGQVGSVLYEAEDDPLLPVGDQVVLFLRPLTDGGATTYAMVGGPEGHLTLQGDRVVTTSADGLTIPAGFTVEQLVAELRP